MLSGTMSATTIAIGSIEVTSVRMRLMRTVLPCQCGVWKSKSFVELNTYQRTRPRARRRRTLTEQIDALSGAVRRITRTMTQRPRGYPNAVHHCLAAPLQARAIPYIVKETPGPHPPPPCTKGTEWSEELGAPDLESLLGR